MKNDLRIVIEEMIGHCLMTKNFPHKVFLLVGTGANGKSTLMNVLFSMFGDLATNVPIKKLERDDYVARLTNKLVNISDDVDFNYIKSSQNIKTLASGDIVPARELYDHDTMICIIFAIAQPAARRYIRAKNNKG